MSPRTLALHVLRALAEAQRAGDRLSLDDLVRLLAVRRADVRAAVSQLHREGLLDAARTRLTLAGFALGAALAGAELPALRAPRSARVVAA